MEEQNFANMPTTSHFDHLYALHEPRNSQTNIETENKTFNNEIIKNGTSIGPMILYALNEHGDLIP